MPMHGSRVGRAWELTKRMPLAPASPPATRPRSVRTSSPRGRPARLRRLVLEAGLALIAACAVAWLIGLLAFIRAIPETVEDGDSRTDASIVLTGGAERLATGLKLLESGKAAAVFVSGVHPQVGLTQVLRAAGEGGTRAEALAPRVDAGRGARDTAGNAAETAAWMRRQGFHSLRLVTASYHMPRSRFEFSHALPEVRVIPHPVFPLPPEKRLWWRKPEILGLIVGEYNKLLLSALVHGGARVLNPAAG